MVRIQQVTALEILDSRGKPTLKVWVQFDSGATASVSVPSGASTGKAEAVERRDGDPDRYAGQGCMAAANTVCNEINDALKGKTFADQQAFDTFLIELDGTPDKSRLGANAILGLSLGFARANATQSRLNTYEGFASIVEHDIDFLPQLTVNLFSGGKHAGGQVPIQDVLLVPVGANTIDESLAWIWDVYQTAAENMQTKYGARPLRADEGGLAPPFPSAQVMLEDALQAIRDAGYHAGDEFKLAVDVASSHFYDEKTGLYEVDAGRPAIDSDGMIERLTQWVDKYAIMSVEDGLAEEDWDHWPKLRQELSRRGAITLGDDLLCTNPDRIQRAIDTKAADALLLKVNQIGTLTEAANAYKLAREAGWHVTISARSGETEDDWLADLAIGWGGDQIKVGSITGSERLAKYNRLIAIGAATGMGVRSQLAP